MVTTAMYPAYRPLSKQVFPQAHHVIDKFQVLRMAIFGIESVRKAATGLDRKSRISLMHTRMLLSRQWNDPNWTVQLRYRVEIWLTRVPLLKETYEPRSDSTRSTTPPAMVVRLVPICIGRPVCRSSSSRTFSR
jgi:transposase